MDGIEVFLVLEKNHKDVCFIECENIEYSNSPKRGIMMQWKGNKGGLSLQGKEEDRESLIRILLKEHKDSLCQERRVLDEKFSLFERVR